MAMELNYMYLLTNNRARVIALEAVFALLGGIINLVSGGLAEILLAFTFWATFLISATIVLLNVCNVYRKLYSKLGRLFKLIEVCYIGLWFLLYAISTILSFIDWGASNIVAYIEFVLFAVDGYVYFKPTKSPEDPMNLLEQQQEIDI